jgi:hypothetical protein
LLIAALAVAVAPLVCARAFGSLVLKPAPPTFTMQKELVGKHPRLHFTASDIPLLKRKARADARWFVDSGRNAFANRLAAPSVPGDADGWKSYLY